MSNAISSKDQRGTKPLDKDIEQVNSSMGIITEQLSNRYMEENKKLREDVFVLKQALVKNELAKVKKALSKKRKQENKDNKYKQDNFVLEAANALLKNELGKANDTLEELKHLCSKEILSELGYVLCREREYGRKQLDKEENNNE